MAISQRLFSFLLILLLSQPLYSAPKIVEIARSQIGITEKKNPEKVLEYLKTVGLNRRASWCAAFVRWCMDKAGVNFPVRSAMAQAYRTKKSIDARKVLRREVEIPTGSLAIHAKGRTGFGHIGITSKPWRGAYGQTIDGNTSSQSLGAGGCVEEKTRKIAPLDYFRVTYFTLLG